MRLGVADVRMYGSAVMRCLLPGCFNARIPLIQRICSGREYVRREEKVPTVGAHVSPVFHPSVGHANSSA